MKCPFCNQEHPDGYQFCPNTGKKIELQFQACINERCESYGKFVLPLDAKFCPQCGSLLNIPSRKEAPFLNNDILTFSVNGISFNMVKVENGSFMMGAIEEQSFADDNEKPVHKVTITNDYYMGEHLVTQKLWKAIMKENPSDFGEGGRGSYRDDWEKLPVDSISWNESLDFIQMLNVVFRKELHGMKFRLPTEAEWEFAARGGNRSEGYLFSGSDNIDEVAWYGDWKEGEPHPVGEKKPNELGLYDMTGNLCEYCQDGYGYYTLKEQINPINLANNPMEGGNCIVRGGCFLSVMKNCRITHRGDSMLNAPNFYNGLRLCLSR